MRLKQQLTQRQRLALTPALRQSLGVLALPAADLAETIRREAAENPILNLRERDGRGAGSAYEVALATLEAPVSLVESLNRQLALMDLPEPVREVALYLVGDLTEEGYLPGTSTETAAETGVDLACVEAAVEALQRCEPAGVGARSLSECLHLQLRDAGESEARATIITDHLDLFATQDWRALRKATGLDTETLQDLSQRLRDLSPYPTERFTAPAETVQPDVTVEPDGAGGHRVTVIGDSLPEMVIDMDLLRRSSQDASAKDYVTSCRQRAESLQRSVAFRRRTLLRIADEIVKHQHRFFAGDTSHLAPLTQADIARLLELHPSTITRALAGKYLLVNGAVYGFGFFLSRAVSPLGDDTVSAYSVQQAIKAMIARESPDAPLSDAAIVETLAADGVDIARRTVAKYRGCMKIPSSFARRKK